MIRFSDDLSIAHALWVGARFFCSLPVYLLRPVQLKDACRLITTRLAKREQLLVDRIRHDVFAHPGSIYHQLFRHAGCELGDIENLIKNGTDAALTALLRAGVYLTVDEFKGRKLVIRGSLRIDVSPEQLRSPRAAYHLPLRSGGSRSSGTPVLIDLRFVRDCAATCLANLDVWDGLDWIKADWETPGAGARFRLTKFAMFGQPPAAWFSQVDPDDPSLPAAIHWNTRALRWSSGLVRRALPRPVMATLRDPTPVVEWLHQQTSAGRSPVLFTFSGSAVRACLLAEEKGISIAGTRFITSGEPTTAARVATIRRAGCVAIPRYGSIECGAIGYGCASPEHADELHLLSHMHALITAGDCAAQLHLPPGALFISALHRQAPFLMINVSMGDQAEIRQRDCGCGWQKLRLTTHLHEIRSFEKLTGGGVTFLGTEVISILEQALPSRFGGAPTDYQLVEGETEAGEPIVALRVHPRVPAQDDRAIRDTFLNLLAQASTAASVMAQLWRDANTVRVVREPPVISAAGKILHLQINRRNRPQT